LLLLEQAAATIAIMANIATPVTHLFRMLPPPGVASLQRGLRVSRSLRFPP
jgi:hypothetical protein